MLLIGHIVSVIQTRILTNNGLFSLYVKIKLHAMPCKFTPSHYVDVILALRKRSRNMTWNYYLIVLLEWALSREI